MATTARRVYLVRDTLTGDERLVRSTKPSRARDRYSNLRLEATLATQEEMYRHGLEQREILDDDSEDLEDIIDGEAQEVLTEAVGPAPAPHAPAPCPVPPPPPAPTTADVRVTGPDAGWDEPVALHIPV